MRDISFQQQIVRDLAWVMRCPGLLDSLPDGLHLVSDQWCEAIYQKHLDKLAQLDSDPRVLEDWLRARHSHRLGMYFEALLAFWFQQLCTDVRLWRNIPVVARDTAAGGQRTLGEFDLLLKLPGEAQLRHWELTVKFYLQHTNAAGETRWIGPGGRDRLDIKLQRMFDHQMTLSRTPEGRHALLKLGYAEARPEAFIKGYLFYPLHQEQPGEPAPGLSPRHLRGWWLPHGIRHIPQSAPDTRWWVVPKRHWLSTVRLAVTDMDLTANTGRRLATLLDMAQLETYCRAHFHTHPESLMVAELQLDGGVWQECARGFLVSPAWPGQSL